jgi:3-oxoacyl-[acyl-carrier protein] reductase
MNRLPKVVVITGGASGMGRASSILFAREGAKVVIVDVDEKAGEGTLAEIRNEKNEASFIRADISKLPDIDRIVSKAIDRCPTHRPEL